ncbi:MAG TPA: hypothetical protein PLU30_21855 [Verrucomicrobiae bacterium]|nr:hypothetical protein [Verrucomicrobiae bacterium]
MVRDKTKRAGIQTFSGRRLKLRRAKSGAEIRRALNLGDVRHYRIHALLERSFAKKTIRRKLASTAAD